MLIEVSIHSTVYVLAWRETRTLSLRSYLLFLRERLLVLFCITSKFCELRAAVPLAPVPVVPYVPYTTPSYIFHLLGIFLYGVRPNS
jgi:hypothetical protein